MPTVLTAEETKKIANAVCSILNMNDFPCAVESTRLFHGSHEALRAQSALAEKHATEAEGHAETLLVENEALRKKVERYERGLNRLDSRREIVVLPWVWSADQPAMPAIVLDRLTQFAENLLDGKEWDGSKP